MNNRQPRGQDGNPRRRLRRNPPPISRVPDPSESKFGGHWIGFHTHPDKTPGTTACIGFHGWVYDEDDDEEEKLNPGWKTSTRGCVQLDNRDIADMAALVREGDQVRVIT